MIVYNPLWKTMILKKITTYQLINDYHFSKGQLDRLKQNSNVEMNTIDILCNILKCRIEDIAEYVDDKSV
ncbi:MAG: XRE family transcriptional regulator [Firmicutes bacterium HGW-Firmicutes-7]|nr:MAG: XRE family transcriptional regulator [Firmicutes bacterium HGW-Firmicutes-7]